MDKKGQIEQNSQLPIKEKKFTQSIEEMNALIPYLKDLMSSCPKDDIIFILYERVDYNSLMRNFTLKSKSDQNNNNAINKFKENLLTEITSLDSFIFIPPSNAFENGVQSNKGNKFKEPKIYDIDGEEATIDASSGETFLFLFDNLIDLNTFISRNNNTNQIIICIIINIDFSEAKKWIKSNGLLNNKKFFFYLSEIPEKSIDSSTNIKINNLPRVAIISNGIIREDKSIKNINTFDIQRDLINNLVKKEYNKEEQAKIEKFLYLENENKRKVVKSTNIYLSNNGFNEIHFYVESKIYIDKRGIKKIKCYPIFFGEANVSAKNMIDNLITTLNGQQLFHDIQCKIKYNN